MLLPRILPFFLTILVVSDAKKEEEKLKVLNCTQQGHFKSAAPTDIYYLIVDTNHSSCMHFVWSTVESPTLYLSHTPDVNKSCTCDSSSYNNSYPSNQDGTVHIPGLNSTFSLAIIFKRMIEFDAMEDGLAEEALNLTQVCSDDNSNMRFTDFSNNSGITWTFEPTNTTFIGKIEYVNSSGNATFQIRTQIPELVKSSRLQYFPKTLYTQNSTTFDLIVEDFEYYLNRSLNRSRLALEMVVIHGINVSNGTINIDKTADDEYTPSVFSTYTYNTSSSSNHSQDNGYIQWKPISYQSAKRKSTSSQQVFIKESASYEECVLEEVPLGLGSALYGTNASRVGGNLTRWFVVFGTSGDKNHYNSDYMTWTVVTGYGEVPRDKVSFVIIITIIVGVGIPAALVLVGGVYVFIRKKPWENIQRLINSKSGRGYSRLS